MGFRYSQMSHLSDIETGGVFAKDCSIDVHEGVAAKKVARDVRGGDKTKQHNSISDLLLLFRQQQSLLLSQGHVHAKLYTPAQLSDECELVVERSNLLEARFSVSLQHAMASILDKKANQSFQKHIETLNNSTR